MGLDLSGYEGPRGSAPNELPEVLECVNRVFRLSRDMEPTMAQEFPLLFAESNAENLRVIRKGGRVVSHVGIFEMDASMLGYRLRVGMIGAVSTLEEERGKGLASLLLADAMEKMKRDGVELVMVSGERSLYDKAGCAIAGGSYQGSFERDDALRSAQRLAQNGGPSLLVTEGGEPSSYVQIYEREPVRYVRPLDNWKKLLSGMAWQESGSGLHYARYAFLAEEGGKPLGYAIFHAAENGIGELVEYAGDREAVSACVTKGMISLGLRELRLTVSWWDLPALSKLKQIGVKFSPHTTQKQGTVKVLDPQGLLDAIRPLLVERAGEVADSLHLVKRSKKPSAKRGVDEVSGMGSGIGDQEEFALNLREETHEIGGAKELAWLFFGLPEEVEPDFQRFMPTRDFLPKKGLLGQVIKAALPIPYFAYGLYYTRR